MNTWVNKRVRFIIFLRRLKQRWFSLPILFLFLNVLTQTTLNNFYLEVIQGINGFTYWFQSLLYLISQLIFFILFLLLSGTTLRFSSSYVIIMGPMIRCVSNIFFTLLLKLDLSLAASSVLFVVSSLMSYLGVYIPLCFVWSQISRRFVDGFESTGAGLCVFGVFNLGLLSNSRLSQQVLDWFEVKPGYLRRLDGFLISMISLQIVLSLFSFSFFLPKEPRSAIQRKQKRKEASE